MKAPARIVIWSCFLLVLAVAQAAAQTVNLTPAQEQMLNALPAAQRQQAMNAIRQINSQAQGTTSTLREDTATSSDVSVPNPAAADLGAIDEPLKAAAHTSLVLNFSPKKNLLPADQELLSGDPLLAKLAGSHVFELNDAGILSLLGLQSIPLLGLNEEDIARRLEAEPNLSYFDIEARILTSPPVGKAALKPFGYDLFESREATFDSPSTGPVPPDYVLGPGDSVRIQLFGKENGTYEQEVSRDGILELPELGPITVAGLTFSEFRADVNHRVSEMLIGTQVSVTMGALRTLRVFVLGDAKRPGSYVVDGLATISSALYSSGGISQVGSLRHVQLKRGGRVIEEFDLYDLLLEGNTSADHRLQPGDVVFIPPVGKMVGVGGSVQRPAIYEVRSDERVADVIRYAGGLAPEAFAAGARLERIDAAGERRILSIDLSHKDGQATKLKAGDTLLVPEVLPDLKNTVVLSGHVQRPGPHQWFGGMRLTDVIKSPSELKPGVDDNYVLIRREETRGRPIEVLSADLAAAFANPEGAENIRMEPRDTVYVFGLSFGRQRIIEPLLDELQLQSSYNAPARMVEVAGNVRAPGAYPLETGMRISDLIRAGGRLSEEAYTLKAELTRYSVVDGEYRATDISDVDLAAILRGDSAADIILTEHDHLSITRVPEWEDAWSVTLQGEVRFPGEYRIRRGETLREVLERAGGLTDQAFPEGAIFLRESLRQREQEQIDTLANRMEADLISLSLSSLETTGSQALATGENLLTQLRDTEAVGRLVIDLEHLASGDARYDLARSVELRNGDKLLVPKQSQEVTVIGETQLNTSHLYREGLTRDDYIELSGGLTRRADKKLIYVVRASGAVVSSRGSRWLGRGGSSEIRPGDTIVVPLETDRIRPLTFWGSVTQILYQAAIAVAAIQTFGN